MIGELFGQLRALQTEKHESNTVVLDSLDWIEPLIWKAVCDEGKVETIEQYAGGYGKGYIRALDLWRTLIKELAGLNHKMHVLLIAHAQIKSFQDPELANAYDRYQLKINERAVKIQLALALARVGDPEDMVYLSQLIEADIQRIRMGRT
jgi:hypothetical protein